MLEKVKTTEEIR